MALDARHACVRRGLMRHELNLHRRMAHLAAEAWRFHVLDAAIRRERNDDEVRRGERHEQPGALTMERIGEVESRPFRTGTSLRSPPTLEGAAHRDEEQAQDEQRRK